MILQQLTISQVYKYKKDEPLRYKGAIKYAGDYGEVSVTLNDETSRRVLAVIADQLVETSREIAQDLTAEIIDTDRALLTSGGGE
jgi:hypothetical protein